MPFKAQLKVKSIFYDIEKRAFVVEVVSRPLFYLLIISYITNSHTIYLLFMIYYRWSQLNDDYK